MTNNDDNGKCAEATICVECKHHVRGIPHKCEVNPHMNYVTGIKQQHNCCIKNGKGQCPDYEERGDDEG